jgi:hypothetical protein
VERRRAPVLGTTATESGVAATCCCTACCGRGAGSGSTRAPGEPPPSPPPARRSWRGRRRPGPDGRPPTASPRSARPRTRPSRRGGNDPGRCRATGPAPRSEVRRNPARKGADRAGDADRRDSRLHRTAQAVRFQPMSPDEMSGRPRSADTPPLAGCDPIVARPRGSGEHQPSARSGDHRRRPPVQGSVNGLPAGHLPHPGQGRITRTVEWTTSACTKSDRAATICCITFR